MKKLFLFLLFSAVVGVITNNLYAQPTKTVLITGDTTKFFSYGTKGNTVEFGTTDTSRAAIRLPRVAHPDSIKTPRKGMIVYCTVDSALYLRQNFGWQKVGSGGSVSVDSSIYATRARLSNELNLKQNTLVSGTNIKTLGGNSLLGSGDFEVISPLQTVGGIATQLSINQATNASDGYLSSTDWNTFNNKKNAADSTTTNPANYVTQYQRKKTSDSLAALIAAGSGWSLTGNSGTTAGTNFWGTTDNVDPVFKRNNTFSGRIGSSDTYLGVSAGALSHSGNSNTAIGASALAGITGASQNTAVGVASLLNLTSGSNNTSIGAYALRDNTTGGGNIAIGLQAGYYNTTLSNQIFINSINRTNFNGDTTASPVYIVQNSTVANQRTKINGWLQVVDGTQGSGKVFTSDANGVGSWQTPSGGGGYTLDTTTANIGLVTDYQRDTATAARLASIALKANDNAVMHLTGNEAATGYKTFSYIRLNNTSSAIDLLGGYGNNHFGFLNAFAPKVNLEGGNASYFAINNSALGVVATIDKSGAANFGGSSSLPVASAALQVTSTTKGFLPPRMTTTNQDAISSPATGLVIYNTTLNCLTQYDGTLWTSLISAIKGTGTIDFASIAAGGNNQNDVTITGAALGDMVYIEQDKAEPNVTYSAWVETTNTIRVKAHNISASSIDPASKSFKIIVYKN